MKALIILTVLLLAVIVALAVQNAKQKSKFEEEKGQLEIDKILALSEDSKALRKFKHDTINQNFTVDMLLQKGDIDRAREILSSHENHIEKFVPKNFCSNYALNALILYENQRCKNVSVALNCDTVLSNEVKLSDTEICTIFSSVFNGAIKSCQKVDCGRTINFVCKKANENVIFVSIDTPTKFKLGKNAIQIIEKYNGKIDYAQNGDRYMIKIFI